MSKTSYKGLDYSLGRSNYNPDTNIHFGVISMHSVPYEYQEEFEQDYGPARCGKCGNPAIDSSDIPEEFEDAEWNEGKDYACVQCERTFWSDEAFSYESIGWSYEREGYKLTNCLDSDIFVLDSPFYTFAQFCSPCVPGAGNLESPCEDGPKTYCLSHDWFDNCAAPYRVYRVSDNTEVLPDTKLNGTDGNQTS